MISSVGQRVVNPVPLGNGTPFHYKTKHHEKLKKKRKN